jgi:hypothetical protein
MAGYVQEKTFPAQCGDFLCPCPFLIWYSFGTRAGRKHGNVLRAL